MEKISVIVPVYNSEKHLADCVNSIINQTYQNLEIILVNDGSTDHSYSIMEDFRQKDDRIRLFNQPNQGRGVARNTGIQNATGDFILFVDSDDYIGTDHVHSLYKALKDNHADIAANTFFRINDDGYYFFFVDDSNPDQQKLNGVFDSQQFLQREHQSKFSHIAISTVVPWCKLYKRSLFKNVYYPDTREGEDNFTTWKLYLAAKRIAFINTGDYCWRSENSNVKNSLNDLITLNQSRSQDEQITTLKIAGLDPSYIYNNYTERLKKLQQASKEAGDSYHYKEATFKLQIINKYTNK